MEKVCAVCWKKFEAVGYTKKYCGVECRTNARKKQIEKKLFEKRKDKFCLKCKKEKIDRKNYYCEKCNKLVAKERYEKHKILTRKNSIKKYYLFRKDPEFKRKRNERYKIYHKKRRKEDLQFQTAIRLRNLFYQALRRYTKMGKVSSSKKYGINFNEIIESLKPFPKDIENWHIDHIIPLSSFNLEDPNEIRKAFSSKNLQWLTASKNIRKGNKIKNFKK